jgi:hypothetical protein
MFLLTERVDMVELRSHLNNLICGSQMKLIWLLYKYYYIKYVEKDLLSRQTPIMY